MMPRALRQNGAADVSMASISSTLVVVVTATLSLKTKLMALSLALGGLYLVQRALVGKRRRSGHWFVQYGAMAAYYLPAYLVFYAAKVVYTSHVDESTIEFVPGVLCMFLLIVRVQQDVPLVTNMRAYYIRHRPRDGYNYLTYLTWLVFLGWVYLEWAWIPCCNCNWCWWRLLPRLLQLGGNFLMASSFLFVNTSESTLDCQTKAVADYMKRESSKSSTSSPFFDDDDDANSNSSLQLLDCCRYPFVQGRNGEWATVKDLVQRDDLPDEDEDKDIWLSYSLCWLLARRYYGFHCAEEGDDKVRRLALADLGTTDGYKRAFTIAEVQLAFLHDYFFTASLPIIESGSKCIDATQKIMEAFTMIISNFFGAIPTAIAMFMSLSALFETPGSLLVKNLLAIYWCPIYTAFRKLNDLPNGPIIIIRFRPDPNAQDVFDPFQAQTGGAYWRNKIGQYSILQDYDRRPSRKKALVAWFQGTMLSQPLYGFIKHLPVEEEEVDMLQLDHMRKLVAHTLRGIDGPPTNGTKSLKLNMDSVGYDWLLTCKQETHMDTILICHIATCYCDMTPISDDPLLNHETADMTPISDDPLLNHETARALSKYCAYLVAFLPEFLPENSLTTKQVFQRVLQEAQGALGMTPMEEKEKYTKMQELQMPDQHEQQTTFHKGVELGRQLELIPNRWKVIAEFLAETILYVAPSDNAEAHIEQLAKGGEFIRHLWAMLSNAGILKRATGEWHPPPTSTTTEGPPTHQLMEAMPSSIDDEASASSSMSSPPIQTLEPPTNEKGKQLLEDHNQ